MRRIGGGLLALTLAATAGLLIVVTTAKAEPAPAIRVDWHQKTRAVVSGQPMTVLVHLDGVPLDEDLLIAGELEGGLNDPEAYTQENTMSYGTPDTFCVIPAGGYLCELPVNIFSASLLGDTLRIFVSAPGASVDNAESANSFFPGCTLEPDSTEVVKVHAAGGFTEPPAPIDPPPGTNANPYTCENPEPTTTTSPSPSGSPTNTGTPLPTGTPTDTGTPTPTATPTDTGTPTPTATPTDTGSPSPTPTPATVITAPYEGRFRTDSCATYFPITQTAPCSTSGAADAATGAAAATATVESIDGEATTLASALASAGIVHSLDEGGRRVVARVRIDRGSIRTNRNAGNLGSPSGSISVTLTSDSECGSSQTSHQVPIDGSGDVEGQIVEIAIDTEYCETATSIRAGVEVSASVSPLSSGDVSVDAAVTVLKLTVM